MWTKTKGQVGCHQAGRMGVSEGGKLEKSAEKIFEEIMTRNNPNLI